MGQAPAQARTLAVRPHAKNTITRSFTTEQMNPTIKKKKHEKRAQSAGNVSSSASLLVCHQQLRGHYHGQGPYNKT